MNILHEIRNAFGFPQLLNIEIENEEQKPTSQQQNNYRVIEGDDEEDYFPQLGFL